ncbi:hypothetical protein [Oerskovia turbata]
MPHTADTTMRAVLVAVLLLGLVSGAPRSSGSPTQALREVGAPGAEDHRASEEGGASAGAPDARGLPGSTSAVPRQRAPRQTEQARPVLAVPGGFATTAWREDDEHVGHVLRVSPDGEQWRSIAIPGPRDARPTLRLDGHVLLVSTDPFGPPVWTVEDVESLVRSAAANPSSWRVGAGLSPRPV